MLTVDAGIAGARRIVALLLFHIHIHIFGIQLLFLSERTRHLGWLIQLEFGEDGFGRAIDDLTILDKALDQPVAISRTVITSVYAGLAQIIVSIITDVAVVVLIRHWHVTNVAVDGPTAS